MLKLSDTQLILLSRASAHEGGVATRPEGMAKAGSAKAAASLVARKLMREIKAKPGMPVWREGEEGRPVSLLITAAGRKAARAEDEAPASEPTASGAIASGTPKASGGDIVAKASKPSGSRCKPTEPAEDAAQPVAPVATAGPAPRSGSKQALVVEMLSTETGTTIDALIDATGWLPHTTRAALTGLRKRGLSITRERQEGKTSVYRIVEAVPATAAAAIGPIVPPSGREQPARAPAAANASVQEAIAAIGSMPIDVLRARWRQDLRGEPPRGFTRDLLARALADRLQVKAFGGLTAQTRKLVRNLGQGGEPPRHIKLGSVIVREYEGVLHEVVVVPGGFLWQGKTFNSLSTIAKRITGTTWNGPRFFGLRGKTDAEAKPNIALTCDEPVNATEAPRRKTANTSRRHGGLAIIRDELARQDAISKREILA